MTFCPITDLLDKIPAKEHLTRAIGLYLECKSTYPLGYRWFQFFFSYWILGVWSNINCTFLFPLLWILWSDKPPIEELRYFLEFQIPRVWAPLHDRILGQQRKEPVCPSLQFSIMGQKLYVSQEQVNYHLWCFPLLFETFYLVSKFLSKRFLWTLDNGMFPMKRDCSLFLCNIIIPSAKCIVKENVSEYANLLLFAPCYMVECYVVVWFV